MWYRNLILAATAILATTPAYALDPSGADIIGLRLGMPETEAIPRLSKQGYPVTKVRDGLTATTRDGKLMIGLAPDRTIRLVQYAFTGRGSGEPDKIRESINDRFGMPNQMKPPTWCRHANNGQCPPDDASLTFLPETLTLILRSGTSDGK
jgi:hypothetical protein